MPRSYSPPRSTNRSTRSRGIEGSSTPLTAAGRSPRSSGTLKDEINTGRETESYSDDETGEIREESPPFYPNNHVRFSPSVKNGSPFGRKTRSGRRGMRSYLQSLPSEDEQSEFNRQYTRDLRRRQARKLSEDMAEEDERGSTRRTRKRQTVLEDKEEEEEVVHRRTRKRGGVLSDSEEEEKPDVRTEDKEIEEEGDDVEEVEKANTTRGRSRREVKREKEAESMPRRSTRRISESQSEVEAPRGSLRYLLTFLQGCTST